MIVIVKGIILSLVVAFIAYRKGSLAVSGFWAALLVGTGIYSTGGLLLWTLLISFFVTSTIAGKIKEFHQPKIETLHTRGATRDWVQVMANGAIPLTLSLMYHLTGMPGFLVAFASSIAAANSDTWASEIGVLSKKQPVSIVTLKPMSPGLSGGVSLLGTMAAFGGALLIALLFVIGSNFSREIVVLPINLVILVTLAGFGGSIIDSFLGALWQSKYRCVACGQIVEMPIHHGKPTRLVSGVAYISNDVVNLTSGFLAATLALFWASQML